MISKIITSLLALLTGGWMIFDGVHVMVYGKYFGPAKPGPWSLLFSGVGIDPFRLGPLFVMFGILWLGFLAAMLYGKKWGWYGAVIMAICSLWYLPLGTVGSVVYLIVLWTGRAKGSWR